MSLMETGMTFGRNLRYAFRGLRSNPGLTAIAIASLALGVGANTAVFSVTDAVLFKPLPIREPDRVITLQARFPDSKVPSEFGYPDYVEFRNQSAAFVDLAAYVYAPIDFSASAGSERILGALVSGNYFDVLGVSPVLGRGFRPEEGETSGTHALAVISDRLWKRHFQSDVGVIGRTVKLNGRSFSVLGVAPANFTGTLIGSAPEVWVPTTMWAGIKDLPAPLRKLNFDLLRPAGYYGWLQLVGRLKTGIGIKAVRAPLNEISARLPVPAPDFRKTIDVAPIQLARLPLQYQSSMPLMMTVIFVVVAGLLLIACANVASLLMGRAFARQKEIAIRLALGARRRHIVGELLTESMLLAAIGGGAGILVALWLVSAFESLRPLLPIPIPVDLGLDFRVLGFTVVVTALSGLAVGVIVAIQTTCVDSAGRLKEVQSAAGADRRPLSTRNVLVIGQVALSLVLLVVAGLLLRTFLNLQSIAIGFDPHNLILLNADFVRHGHSETSAITAYQRLLEQVQILPGVQSASLAWYVPLTSTRGTWKYDEQKTGGIQLRRNAVTPGYFQTMGIPLLRGRDFKAEDREGGQKVAIVNETYAQMVFKGGDPIGQQFDGKLIIGLVKDNKSESLRPIIEPWSFVPFLQSPEPRMSLVIRTIVDPRSMIETVYHAGLKVDPEMTASSVRLMTDQVKGLLWQPRMAAILVGAFALLAALLAVVGVYGAVSFDASRRSHEIGIRMAIGADRGNVLRMVLARGILLGSTGAGLGILVALGLSRLLASMLYGVGPTDLVVFAVVAILLVLVAAMASLIPARRAASVNPIEVLRYQ